MIWGRFATWVRRIFRRRAVARRQVAYACDGKVFLHPRDYEALRLYLKSQSTTVPAHIISSPFAPRLAP